MLVAPIYEPVNKRQVYFPPGTWTSLDTDQQYPGRRTAAIETDGLPVFAHNGAIVPLDSADGGIGLHYFPSLGGEFFFLEKDFGTYSQVHAAPAGDILRLEIESKKDRVYRWVIHHVERPTSVGFEDHRYKWSYDAARKNLAIEVPVKAGEDNVIHVSW
jgi:alpha-glucosidase (family GH31 glycosyl hydrolase)